MWFNPEDVEIVKRVCEHNKLDRTAMTRQLFQREYARIQKLQKNSAADPIHRFGWGATLYK